MGVKWSSRAPRQRQSSPSALALVVAGVTILIAWVYVALRCFALAFPLEPYDSPSTRGLPGAQ